jgi:hypothetical protein
MLQDLTPASFEAHIGSTLYVHFGGTGPLNIIIREVKRHEPHPGPRAEPFSVYFLGPSGPVLAQSIYRTEHAILGMLEIFLVPIGPDPNHQGIQYEAVFN